MTHKNNDNSRQRSLQRTGESWNWCYIDSLYKRKKVLNLIQRAQIVGAGIHTCHNLLAHFKCNKVISLMTMQE